MACMLPVSSTLRCGRRKARVAVADCLDKITIAMAESLDAADALQNIHITIAEGLGRDSAERFSSRQLEASKIGETLHDIGHKLKKKGHQGDLGNAKAHQPHAAKATLSQTP